MDALVFQNFIWIFVFFHMLMKLILINVDKIAINEVSVGEDIIHVTNLDSFDGFFLNFPEEVEMSIVNQ